MLLSGLEQFVLDLGEPRFRAAQIASWVFEKGAASFEEMTNLPKLLRARLHDIARITTLRVVQQSHSRHSPTSKYLLGLDDGQTVETVLIGGVQRNTLCISTQVGCALACRFCASGLAGLSRNMTAGEIVDQVIQVQRRVGDDRTINNVVLMGMGEPLANYDAVLRAVRIINAPWGLGIGARKITISTSGLVPNILRLATEGLQVELSVSLHAADDDTRSFLMPINRRYPLRSLLDACTRYVETTNRLITFEYILLKDVNDGLDDAGRLIALLRDLLCKVNLIPYNPVDGLPFETPDEGRQAAFLRVLQAGRITTTIRRERGRDIDAACGQLRLKESGQRSVVGGR
ncbi:MAG: 23S rRNA (adenine(2503)-C(2))-methyltransferase RlmN [Candidatus Latescibacteria bacterium]|nr:23S rRNA (adenine(2503)-C(2))-methyltransferase RlmN [Candidatus Latescibacterota bacterium]